MAKVRTWKKTLARMADVFKEGDRGLWAQARGGALHRIGGSAIEWAREAIEPVVGRTVDVLPVSPMVIGVHVGPAVGIAYECERPVPGKLAAPASELVFSV